MPSFAFDQQSSADPESGETYADVDGGAELTVTTAGTGAAEIIAGGDYIILFFANTTCADFAESFHIRLTDDGTAIPDAECIQEFQVSGDSQMCFAGFVKLDNVTDTNVIKFQHRRETGGSSTVTTDFTTLLAIRVDDISTDYWKIAEDLTDHEPDHTDWETAEIPQVSFTGGGDDWLGMATSRWGTGGNINSDTQMRLNRGDSDLTPSLVAEPEDTSVDFIHQSLMRTYSALSGSQTLETNVKKTGSQGTQEVLYSAVLALNLTKIFEDSFLSYTDGVITINIAATPDYGTEVEGIDGTASSTVDYVAIGSFLNIADEASNFAPIDCRMDMNTTTLTTKRLASRSGQNDREPVFVVQKRAYSSSASIDVALDASVRTDLGSPPPHEAAARCILVFGLKRPAAAAGVPPRLLQEANLGFGLIDGTLIS